MSSILGRNNPPKQGPNSNQNRGPHLGSSCIYIHVSSNLGETWKSFQAKWSEVILPTNPPKYYNCAFGSSSLNGASQKKINHHSPKLSGTKKCRNPEPYKAGYFVLWQGIGEDSSILGTQEMVWWIIPKLSVVHHSNIDSSTFRTNQTPVPDERPRPHKYLELTLMQMGQVVLTALTLYQLWGGYGIYSNKNSISWKTNGGMSI